MTPVKLCSSMRPRRIRRVLFIACLVAIMLSGLRSTHADQKTCAPPSSSNMYEWEDANYYEILELPSPPAKASRQQRRKKRGAIESADVRKAYRKQAQRYHPDKVARNQTTTVEETNARFARIAEAYEVLNDEQKRREYDDYLLDCEDHLTATAKEDNSRWSVFDDFQIDPRRVFEEFFFGSASAAEEPTWEDVTYNNNDRRQHSRDGSYRSTPVRVYETREVHRDPYTGAEILRILQTEEFPTNAQGQLFYRVTGQDFVEQYDRFHGWTYVPVTQPFPFEEGYKQDSHHGTRPEANTLSPGEFLTRESAMLTSSSGQYYAGISSDCELLIMSDAWVDDTVVWSSGTYVPPSHLYNAGGCFLGLRGPHLMLALGSPDRPGTILWYSDVPESVVEEEERIRAMGGPSSLYVARLDDDGNLAVYRHETAPRTNDEATETSDKRWWSKILGKADDRLPQTRAAQAWVRLQKWTRDKVIRHQSDSFPREVCIYATGPAGCNTPGRKIFHIAYGVGHSVKHTVNKIDSAIDTFVESIGEDEDLLDIVFRVANQASNGLLRAGQSLFRIQARLFHTFYNSMMKRFYATRQ